MKRRNFIENTVKSIALLSGTNALQVISALKFKLPLREEIKFRYAIASDGHYGQPETEYDSFHDDMMRWLKKEHEQHPLACCIFNGDLIHDNPVYFPEVKKKYDSLSIPYYVSRGNHDRCDAQTWRNIWGCELNYSFEIDNAAFIVLDTSNITGEYLCPDIQWVKKAFDKYKSKKHIFVIMHITPVKWTEAGIDCPELVEVFARQKNLKGIFHGHDHMEDNAKIKSGKAYFFDSHIGGNWGTNYHGYRIVEVLKSDEIITYQVNPANASRVNNNTIK
jgi:Icc protein